MSIVRVPPVLRDVVGGSREIPSAGDTVGEVLDGLFAGLKNRGLTFGDVEPNPMAAGARPIDTLPENFTAEERIKRELAGGEVVAEVW